jgi:hypothetical protein
MPKGRGLRGTFGHLNPPVKLPEKEENEILSVIHYWRPPI